MLFGYTGILHVNSSTRPVSSMRHIAETTGFRGLRPVSVSTRIATQGTEIKGYQKVGMHCSRLIPSEWWKALVGRATLSLDS